MRELTDSEIEKLASRKGVRRIAVENFLATVTACKKREYAIGNLYMDASLYRWNVATVEAIRRGIELASKEEGRATVTH